ncbi:hypothetical protein Glove_688g25 [Diversispora epigaea]|uniref:Uncharacterized protein n=1 Tax=Diversispora epigaea TaxID=1348612 RepID=A0A397G2I4_9GLOM|nr:hypothetical protein Glove_688g25 [Diversispora epigaea]
MYAEGWIIVDSKIYIVERGFWKAKWKYAKRIVEFYNSNQVTSQKIYSYPGNLIIFRSANEILFGIFGILPYIAPPPNVINQKPLPQTSDVYSDIIIMWIILIGEKSPFLIDGLCLEIDKSTSECYVKLMGKCWHKC